MRYPNLVLSWGMVDDEMLLKWFMQTHAQAQPQEITLTLDGHPGRHVERDVRKFTFADAFPVHWSGPRSPATAPIPRRGARRSRSPTPD